MFVTHFVGVRRVFRGCSLHYRKPSAAVGADSSCPHIRIRNAFAIRWDTFGNPLAALSQTVSSVTQTTSSRRDRFIVPTYTYSPCIRNPFEMPSRNVRNVFILCMLHIRYAKVWFLRHKSMVFGVQKPPFYIAKTPFLKYQNGVLNLEHIRQY